MNKEKYDIKLSIKNVIYELWENIQKRIYIFHFLLIIFYLLFSIFFSPIEPIENKNKDNIIFYFSLVIYLLLLNITTFIHILK